MLQDYGYKDLFGHRELIYDLVTHFFQTKDMSAIDVNSLEKINAHYIDEKYRRRENDVVWKMRVADEWVYLYLMLEFQSKTDKYMAIRLMGYISLLYQDLIKSKILGKKRKLPPILPWVIYTGETTWSAPQHSYELLEPTIPNVLKKHFPCFHYRVLDIGHYRLKKGDSEKNNLIIPLIELEQCVYDRTYAQSVIKRLAKQLRSSEHDSLRRAFSIYINRVLNLKGMHSDNGYDTEEDLDMLAERMKAYDQKIQKEAREAGIEEGIQKGRQEGIKEGIKEGRKEGMRKLILALLKKGVSKELIAEVASFPLEELNGLKEL